MTPTDALFTILNEGLKHVAFSTSALIVDAGHCKKKQKKRCLCHYAETGIIRRWQRLHRTSSAAPIPTRPEYSIHSHAMRHLFRRCVPRQGQIVCK